MLPATENRRALTTADAAPPHTARVQVSVIVPTRNESGNVHELYQRLDGALRGRSWEVVFVDDSDDPTPFVIAGVSRTDGRVRCVHRPAGARHGGLSGAVLRGFAAARSDVLVVMDGDLQHPPELVPELVAAVTDSGADLAVASRYVTGGSSTGLSGRFRTVASQGCRRFSRLLLPVSRATTDPLSGFFALRRSVVAGVDLRPEGFKILLEVLARGRWNSVLDVPFRFDHRHSGRSKSSITESRRFLHHVSVLWRTADHGSRGTDHRRPSLVDPDDRMRVLVFTSEAPPVISGISTAVGGLARTHRERGHDVTVISRADFPHLVWRECRLSAFALTWFRIRRRVLGFDVVNVHGPVPSMSETFLLLAAATLPRHRRPAIVYTHHSDLSIPGLETACEVYNRINYRIARVADLTVVSSEDYAATVRSRGIAKVEAIPWGVDPACKVLPRVTSVHQPLKLLFVGQLRPYKGVHVLLEAMADLPPVSLTIIGDGPLLPEVREQVARDGLDRVEIRGRVSEQDLWQAYSEHDVVVLPSLTRAEAFGLVLLEGMAAGCVPIASDLPGVRSVVGSSGLLVPPGDSRALRQAILDLDLDRERLARLAADAVTRSRDMSVEAAGQRYEQVFRRAHSEVLHRRAALALPRGWRQPVELLDVVTHRLGAARASISLVPHDGHPSAPTVYRRDGLVGVSREAPVAAYVGRHGDPVVINSGARVDAALRGLLRRPEVTSAIVMPLRELSHGVSVLSVSTLSGDPVELGSEHLDALLELLDHRRHVVT
ncbi:glycosyltransferase [Modestobacter marinus]|uniref:glycosyltransferase n=1 Tax=Modestobacter marinus TaxID=477641 RepID=UPI001C957690|nr:glycosyltransferase [Modestobacter marinus]